MLTACILFDNGKAHLKQRIDVLHGLVTKHTNPPLHGDDPKLSAEEEFVKISMKSKTMHARAKLIVMQILNQIQNPEKCVSSSKVRILDYSKATVTQIFQEMLNILKKDCPQYADQISADIANDESDQEQPSQTQAQEAEEQDDIEM